MKPRDYIQKFCANPESDIRLYLTKPVRLHDQLIASDGHILIVTDFDPDVELCEVDKLICASHEIRNGCLFVQDDAPTAFHPIHDLPLPEPELCPTCQGRGAYQHCTHCDGSGDEPDDEFLAACDKCGGAGHLLTDLQPQVVCIDCDGYKFKRTQVFPVLDGHFSRRYIELLQSLPGIEFATNPGNPIRGVAYFRFTSGYGALMPCRPE